jgi:hypothetical protein
VLTEIVRGIKQQTGIKNLLKINRGIGRRYLQTKNASPSLRPPPDWRYGFAAAAAINMLLKLK